MKGLFRLGMRIIWRYRFRIFFFATCIAIGVAFLFSVGNVVTTVGNEVSGHARQILAADIRVSSYRAFQEKTDQAIYKLRKQGCRVSKMLYFFSMAKYDHTVFLARIKAIENSYPLYGKMQISPSYDKKEFANASHCLIDDVLCMKYGLKLGDSLKIGSISFTIKGIIRRDPSRIFGISAFVPTIMIPFSKVKGTELVQFGSRVRHNRLIALAENKRNMRELKRIKKYLEDNISTPHVRIVSYDDSQDNIRRILKRQGSFYFLVSIITLLVGAVGMASSVTTFLNEQLETVGTLRCLGIGPKGIFHLYLGICLVIGILGGILGGLLGILLSSMGLEYLKYFLEINIAMPQTLHWQYWVEAIFIACLLTIGINIFKIRSLARISPLDILRGKVSRITSSKTSTFLMVFFLTLSLFVYTLYKSASLKIATFFSLGLILTVAATFILILACLKILSWLLAQLKKSHTKIFILRNGMRQMVRQKNENFYIFALFIFRVYLDSNAQFSIL